MDKLETKERIQKLREVIDRYRWLYHVKDDPEISDEAYDSLKRELEELEEEYPELITDTSPTQRVGGEPLDEFTQVEHEVRQYSFDNVFSREELEGWHEKTLRFAKQAGYTPEDLEYLCELKIDGLKVILTYEDGQLVQAATRGDGRVGEDVTQNVKTIQTIPLNLPESVDMIVSGEVWLSETEFDRINEKRTQADENTFANPRNAAAGTIRQLDPQVVAGRNLDFFAHDIERITGGVSQSQRPGTIQASIELLKKLHFPTNPGSLLSDNLDDIQNFYQRWTEKKENVDFAVDGVVLKVSNLEIQKALGHTATAPRYAVAYKFPAETTTTKIQDIELQVGRTGAITPVAHLKPVELDRTTVSRATLHNEDEIQRLDARIGDTVIIKKAGDIIPQVVEVLDDLRDGSQEVFAFPDTLDACGGDGEIIRPPGEVKHRCKHPGRKQKQEQLEHFASRDCFDIDGLGPQIIDQLLAAELIDNFADIFRLQKDELLELERFADKSAENILDSIEAAREIELPRFLHSLSIDFVGAETARLLAKEFETIDAVRQADNDDFTAIDGIGPKVAKSVSDWFSRDNNSQLLDDLLSEVSIIPYRPDSVDGPFTDTTVVFTGSLDNYTRQEASEKVREQGGNITSSVSSRTDYLVVGDNPGSKLEQAQDEGVRIIDEATFEELLHTS